jgi:hypothetical protein
MGLIFSVGGNSANKPSIFGTNPTQPATNNPFGGSIFGTNQQQPPQPGTSAFGTGTGTFGTNVPQNQPTPSCTSVNYHLLTLRNPFPSIR